MSTRQPITYHRRKYIIHFLKMCPKQKLQDFLTDKISMSDEYRYILIRYFVNNRTPKQLSLELNSSAWWVGERLKRAEELLIPQLETFVISAISNI